jgi:AAHS family benzoate transporter-like MFS transporter
MAYYLRKNSKDSIRKVLSKAAPGFAPTAEDEYAVRVLPGGKKASVFSLLQPALIKNSVLFAIIMFIIMFTFYGLNVWIPKMMTGQGYALGSSLMMMFLFNSGGLVTYPTMGLLADRIGYKPALTLCYIAFGLFVVCFGKLPHNFLLLMVIIFFAGGIGTALISLTSVYVGVCHPVEIRSTAIGTVMAIGRIGGAVGPTILGMFQYYKVSFWVTLLFLGALALVGGLLIVLTKDTSKITQSLATAKSMATAGSSSEG